MAIRLRYDMARISVPEEDWKEVFEDLQKRKAQIKMGEKQEHEKSRQNFALNDIENAVLKFIKDHPGTSKQGVVDYFDRKKSNGKVNQMEKAYTRVPLFRTIASLVDCGMVIDRKDNSNRQTYNLFIDSENLLVSLVNDFDNFEKGYQGLVNDAKVQFAKMASLRKSSRKDYRRQLRERPIEKELLDDWFWDTTERKMQGEEESILFGLLCVYKAFIFLHIFIALFKWPLVTSDSMMLTKLYAEFFTRIRELHPRLLESIPGVFGRRRDTFFLGTRAAKVMGIESLFKELLGLAGSKGVDDNFTSVTDSIWKNVYDFLSWSKGCDKEELKDWRAVFEVT